MSLDGRLREIAEAAVVRVTGLVYVHRRENEAALKALSERVARLEAAPGPVNRGRKETT